MNIEQEIRCVWVLVFDDEIYSNAFIAAGLTFSHDLLNGRNTFKIVPVSGGIWMRQILKHYE